MMTQGVIENERIDTTLKTADFFYELPEELIAQVPLERRDSSRLMVLNREEQRIAHRHFYDILDYLKPEDMLIVNSSKVIPARLLGVREDTGSPIELLLLRVHENGDWETLVRPGKRARAGHRFCFGDVMQAEILSVLEDGNRIVRLTYDKSRYQSIYDAMNEVGQMPLPPYIKEKLKDKDRYQTVYAKQEGSAAAPTAGLHFTNELLARVKEKGVGYGEVTLHVGLGTFRPVKEENITDHVMHTEHFCLSEETANEINRRKKAGGRIIAVGTTACRVLESASDEQGTLHAMEGETGIFIYPGYRFKAVDALITNFHLPESTLLMLVSALAGKEFVMGAYEEAVQAEYRFFSFGDAMLIV